MDRPGLCCSVSYCSLWKIMWTQAVKCLVNYAWPKANFEGTAFSPISIGNFSLWVTVSQQKKLFCNNISFESDTSLNDLLHRVKKTYPRFTRIREGSIFRWSTFFKYFYNGNQQLPNDMKSKIYHLTRKNLSCKAVFSCDL